MRRRRTKKATTRRPLRRTQPHQELQRRNAVRCQGIGGGPSSAPRSDARSTTSATYVQPDGPDCTPTAATRRFSTDNTAVGSEQTGNERGSVYQMPSEYTRGHIHTPKIAAKSRTSGAKKWIGPPRTPQTVKTGGKRINRVRRPDTSPAGPMTVQTTNKPLITLSDCKNNNRTLTGLSGFQHASKP